MLVKRDHVPLMGLPNFCFSSEEKSWITNCRGMDAQKMEEKTSVCRVRKTNGIHSYFVTTTEHHSSFQMYNEGTYRFTVEGWSGLNTKVGESIESPEFR